MTSPPELEQYLRQRYGDANALIVKDPESTTGIRTWNEEDTQALCRWLNNGSASTETVETTPGICHNVEQTAKAMGVGVHTIQGWLRRKRDPLPHLRDGRRILIPRFLLIRWVREEAERNLQRRAEEADDSRNGA